MTATSSVHDLPRLVTLMGSGELSPTMVKTHRYLLDRLGPPPVPAVFLPTPFGFQENADELSQRAISYFHESLTTKLEVAGNPTIEPGDERSHTPFAAEQVIAQVRGARYVFSGPGSPSFALRYWQDSAIPSLLREKLTDGGAVTFASAASLTLGTLTVPVYEIYKVGQDPFWLEGMNVLSAAGLNVAVIPHFDNAEGGTHDTRFCYLGERRLKILEDLMPSDCFVLGVDEHTGCVIDLDEQTFRVVGHGGLTVRRQGQSTVYPTGTSGALEELHDVAFSNRKARIPTSDRALIAQAQPQEAELLAFTKLTEATFDEALRNRDSSAAIAAIIDLSDEIVAADREDPDRSRANERLRAMLFELGVVAKTGLRDERDVLGPTVQLVIEERNRARNEKRFATSDGLRDGLAELGIELRDGPDGTEWVLRQVEKS